MNPSNEDDNGNVLNVEEGEIIGADPSLTDQTIISSNVGSIPIAAIDMRETQSKEAADIIFNLIKTLNRRNTIIYDYSNAFYSVKNDSLHRLKVAGLYDLYGDNLRFMYGENAASYPKNVFEIILTRYEQLPKIERITKIPIIDSEGNINSTTGYQPENKVFYPNKFAVTLGNTEPTPQNVLNAKAVLDDLLCDFAFVSPIDKIHSIAVMLSTVTVAITGPSRKPIFVVKSAQSQTGKGKLLSTCLIPALGPHTKFEAAGRTEEVEKQIKATLSEGKQYIVVDNVKTGGTFNSDSMLSWLTEAILSFRILGTNVTQVVPNTVIWGMTGNNIVFSEEFIKRMILINMVWQLDEHPELRTGWRHPYILKHAWDDRDNILTALFTLVKNWIDLGKPNANSNAMSNFPDFKIIIDIISAAGYTEPFGDNKSAIDGSDPEVEAVREILTDRYNAHLTTPFITNDVFYQAQKNVAVFSQKTEHGRKVKLGRILKNNIKRPFTIRYNDADLVIRYDSHRHGNKTKWTIIDTEEEL